MHLRGAWCYGEADYDGLWAHGEVVRCILRGKYAWVDLYVSLCLVWAVFICALEEGEESILCQVCLMWFEVAESAEFVVGDVRVDVLALCGAGIMEYVLL